LEYGTAFQTANQTAYLDSTLRWGLDWLIKAHPSPNVLYVHVGDDERDNDYWGGDQSIPTPRPAYQVNDTHPGTDVAASTSAAFSSCGLLYSNKTLSPSTATIPSAMINTTYATTLFNHSRQLFSFAVNATGGMAKYQDSVPEIAGAYSSTSYGDDLALAAIFLGVANSSIADLQLAKSYWDQYHLENGHLAVDWDSKAAAVPVLMSQVLSAFPSLASSNGNGGQDANAWKSAAESFLDQMVAANEPGYLTPGGLLYFDGSSTLASLNPALNAAMLLVKYAALATSESKKNGYMVGLSLSYQKNFQLTLFALNLKDIR
jgi:endoglucanase